MANAESFFATYETLAAPASGISTPVQLGSTINTRNYTLFVTVSGVHTHVVVTLNGSIDGTNWSKLIANTTINSNGTTHYSVSDHPVRYIQPVFVSESGGSDATVLFSVGAN